MAQLLMCFALLRMAGLYAESNIDALSTILEMGDLMIFGASLGSVLLVDISSDSCKQKMHVSAKLKLYGFWEFRHTPSCRLCSQFAIRVGKCRPTAFHALPMPDSTCRG